MRRSYVFANVLGVAVAAASLFVTRAAHATLVPSCGGLDFAADSSCQLETSGGCSADCTSVKFEASCAAQLEVSCSGGCTVSADVSCTGGCEANCMGGCTDTPGGFDCQGSCETDCEASCSGNCASEGNTDTCSASCKASCANNCNVSCQATPPMATCEEQCQASCSGSCTAQANFQCDVVMCQANGFASCQTSLQGGCMAQCSQPMGALYCDGQYVNVAGDVQDCINDLKNLFPNITIMAEASGSCSGNECTAQASASASCDVANEQAPLPGGLLALGFVAIGGSLARRRRSA